MTVFRTLRVLALVAITASAVRCTPASPVVPSPMATAPRAESPDSRLTAEAFYAGEVLACLLPVVLGRAGNPALGAKWRTCALGEPLDFSAVQAAMDHGEKSRFMVLDTDILGLCRVLYHYDFRMNQFKGRRVVDSLYPSAELLALRLFMLSKLARNERINLDAVLAREILFTAANGAPDPTDLAAMQLNSAEFALIRDVIRSEPHFLALLRHPFLVTACHRLGLIEPGPMVRDSRSRARCRNPVCRGASSDRVDLLLVPSLTAAYGWPDARDRLIPSNAYLDTVAVLQSEILAATRKRMAASPPRNRSIKIDDRIAFHAMFQRPLAICPENAEEILADLCPEFDFAVIVLGKDVYRALNLDAKRNVYPAVNRIYVDETDLRYGQAGEALDRVGEFVAAALAS